ncbi:hypothetical protein ACFL3R_00685 [Thermodesulfobacteriota bacterium]
MSDNLKPYQDPHNEGNSPKHLTGHLCIELGCNNLAGTAWSPHWCFDCNVFRMDKITEQLESLVESKGQENE